MAKFNRATARATGTSAVTSLGPATTHEGAAGFAREFLKAKGVELKDGSYSRKIQDSCSLLADAINAGQKGLERARDEIDKKLDQLRQVIHEKTAPSTNSTAQGSRPNADAERASRPTKPRKNSPPRRRGRGAK